jgi:DNA-binding XRE family transcriptional regulator
MNGDELKERRTSLGMTQVQLADVLAVKPNTVARWERGLLAVPQTVALAMVTVEREHGRSATAGARPTGLTSKAGVSPNGGKPKRAPKKGGRK